MDGKTSINIFTFMHNGIMILDKLVKRQKYLLTKYNTEDYCWINQSSVYQSIQNSF